MSPEEIKRVRYYVGTTQTNFARLLGVHPMTVCKWERGVSFPNEMQVFLLEMCGNHIKSLSIPFARRYHSLSLKEFWRAMFAERWPIAD